MVSVPLTPLNVLLSSSPVVPVLTNLGATSPVSAHLISHHHHPTSLITFSWNKFWGKDLPTFTYFEFYDIGSCKHVPFFSISEITLVNNWSEKRRGKGLNPRGQAEAVSSTKEPEEGRSTKQPRGQERPRM